MRDIVGDIAVESSKAQMERSTREQRRRKRVEESDDIQRNMTRGEERRGVEKNRVIPTPQGDEVLNRIEWN